MSNIKIKELVPDFLTSIDSISCDEQISAYRILPKFLSWLQKNHNLVLREPIKVCNHKWEILEKYQITEPHWFDNHPVQRLVVIQICKCGKLRKEIL
jgi:hypothetical protein